MPLLRTPWIQRLLIRWGPFNPEIAALGAAVSALVAVLAFLAAVVGIVVALAQIRANDQSEKERIAQNTFREFLKLAIQEPDFAIGHSTCNAFCMNPEEKYEWFVSYFLHSAEQIQDAFPTDVGWCKALASHMCRHSSYLQKPEFKGQYIHHYSGKFQSLIRKSLEQCPTVPVPKEYFPFCGTQ